MNANRRMVRRAIGLVLVSFVVAGVFAPAWDRIAGTYTGMLAGVSRNLIPWLEPAPLVDHVDRSGTRVQLVGPPPRSASVGSVECMTTAFYLPFIVLVLGLARFPLRVITGREVVLVLAAVFVVHVASLSLGIQVLEVDALRSGGYAPLVGPVETAFLRTLHHIHTYSGAQLWAGLVVALVLLRAGATVRDERESAPRWNSTGALAAACGVLLLPAVLYLVVAPPLRIVTGRDRSARLTVALASLRAGDRDRARALAAGALDPDRPDVEAMTILALAAEETSPEEAEQWYRRIVASRPHDRGARLGLARAQVRRGHRDAAIATYYDLLAIAPDDADAYRALGDLYRASGNLDAADVHDDLAVRYRPALAGAVAGGAHLPPLAGGHPDSDAP